MAKQIQLSGLNARGERYKNLADPVQDQDAATKKYVDSVVPSVASGSDIITGTDNAKYATAKAIADSNLSLIGAPYSSSGKIYGGSTGQIKNDTYWNFPNPSGQDIDSTKIFWALIYLCKYGTSVADTQCLYLVKWRGPSSVYNIVAIYEGAATNAPRLFNDGNILKVKLNTYTALTTAQYMAFCIDSS